MITGGGPGMPPPQPFPNGAGGQVYPQATGWGGGF